MDGQHTVTHARRTLPGYLRLEGECGAVVRHAPALADHRGHEILAYLERGLASLPDLLGLRAPALEALIVADEDWNEAPRDSSRAYPPGLPYFTLAEEPPTLVIPETLSDTIQPHTPATLPLVVYHELAHAFLSGEVVTCTPAWLRELLPQAASAAVSRRAELPLYEHLARTQSPGFTVRGFRTPASAGQQMAFQNLLLALGSAALEEFGEGFLIRLSSALHEECELDRARAEEVLADTLGEGGREWLASRKEF